MNFIIVFEDGRVYKSDTLTDEDKLSCDAGVIEIIDTSNMMTYYEGTWNDIPIWGESD